MPKGVSKCDSRVALQCGLARTWSSSRRPLWLPVQRKVWFCVPLFPVLILFFISTLAETNRAPFDLPEAEAELVAGYNVEYSSLGFALFFLGAYANMIVMSSLSALFFLGGWLPPINFYLTLWIPGVFWFGIKIVFFLFLFIWVRG